VGGGRVISRTCYCNRTDAQRSIDFKDGLDVNAAMDRAMMSAADNIDGDMKRVFFPSDDTRWFDWPNQGGEGGGQYAEPWRLYLDDNDLACLTELVSGGVTIPLTAIFPGPVNNPQKGKPYYSRIELDRSQSYAFGNNAQTPQLSIAMSGTWAYSALADTAGTLAADVGDGDTTITVSDGSQAGPGDLIILGYGRGTASGSLPWAAGIQPYQGERVLITDVSAVATGLTQAGSGVESPSASDNALMWSGSGSLNAGEVIVLDQEDLLIEQIVGSVATVRRSWNGTALSAHSGAAIYAFRQLSVDRAQLGTAASTYESGAAVYRHRIPPLIRDLSIAETTGRLLQEGSGYARTVGSGEGAHPAPGIALADLWDEARMRHGRKGRTRGV
jgi:hypothetical protein